MDKVYLELDVETFEKEKLQAKKQFEENCPNDDGVKYQWPDLEFDCSEDEFKDGFLTLSGSLKNPKTDNDLGYVSIKMKMDSERTIEVINAYMKKLNRLKTVLEATK